MHPVPITIITMYRLAVCRVRYAMETDDTVSGWINERSDWANLTRNVAKSARTMKAK